MKRVLNDLGVLLIPPGAVSLFCQVLDISAQRTAAYSLVTMLLIACCYYRGLINSKVPSALVIALLVGLSTIFFFNYQNILLKDTGLIKRYKRSADFQSDVGNLIEKSQHEIWFFGANFHISATDRKQAILERLQNGVKIHYLILDPFTAHMDQIAKDFDSSVGQLKSECLNSLDSLLVLKKAWEQMIPTASHPGELEIRFYDSTPHARIYVFDPSEESGRTLFIPYMNRVNSPELPAYLLENSKSGVYSSYFGGVQKLWLSCSTISEYLASHPDVK